MRNRSLLVSCICIGALALPASADLVFASGAGSSIATAQDVSGIPVSEISGNFGLNSNDPAVNLFKIMVELPLQFSAQSFYTGAFGVPDTELFLFDANGLGVYFNDDISAGNTQSCLPSRDGVTNPCAAGGGLGPGAAGIYYLGIAYSANGPVDANGNEIFTNVASTDVVGPNPGAGPLAGWDGNSFTQPDTDLTGYDIVVSGTTPEPAMFLPLILMLGGIVVYRSRRATSTNP